VLENVKEVSSIPLQTEHFEIAPLSDVDGDPERKGEKAYQQRQVYQQDVFTVSLDRLATSALLTVLSRGDSVILGIVTCHLTFRGLC
jgi:hypothetical protein